MRYSPNDGASPARSTVVRVKSANFSFTKIFVTVARRLLLRQIRHHFREKFLQLFFAGRERFEIGRKGFLGAERFAFAIRLDRPLIDPAAKIVKFGAEFAENVRATADGRSAAARRRS